MKKKIYFLSMLIFLCWYGCKEEGRIDHIDDSAPAPAQVTVESTFSRPGGAVIKYKIPDDENLLGVKVVYTRNGEICESKASKYVDTLVVEGFGNTDSQEVKLYSVGVNGKLSTPVLATIKPLVPPVRTTNFDIESTFGGVVVLMEKNYSKADLSIVLLADTLVPSSTGRRWAEMQTFYTKSPEMKFSRRGLKSKEAYFAAYLRDRWNNVSDTIYKTLTPIEEIKLPKTEFRNAMLPTDTYDPVDNNNGYRMEQLWLGPEQSSYAMFATRHNAPIPQWFTIDLGHKMSISRIQKWPRPDYELYSSVAPRVFQVWGSMNPNPDGSWDDSWHLLGEFEQFKPSGYGEGREVGPITDEDKDYWYNKTEFELTPTEKAPDPHQTVTHLRFKILSTFATYGTDATRGQMIIAELTFWGQLKD
ncbi:MAG TPA: hypothetical protein DEF88_12065 [Porphyromonadaceae bacterium]|jgi:hypothetical protein|nr:hypothetical protein [Porphyromonadaceae bacterium]HCM20858.1 hypothetical protein [Porphyromonadaceae bacterium]